MSKGAALVTGGAVRLGAAIAERLAREGRPVAIHCNRSVDEARALAVRLKNVYGIETCVVARDLSEENLTVVVREAGEKLGRLDVLVNSASIFGNDSLGSFASSAFDFHMAVNVRAPLLLSRAFAEQSVGGGSIVNLLDQRVSRTTPRYFSYTLSKCALRDATRTMAQDLGPRGIRVNGVSPGLTLMNEHQDPADFERRISTLPLARGGSATEIADAVSFLLASPSITGQIIAVDGGQGIAWQTPDVSVASIQTIGS